MKKKNNLTARLKIKIKNYNNQIKSHEQEIFFCKRAIMILEKEMRLNGIMEE
ncbi:MAG: hypothetical protein AABY22_30385 [Nanoarchaeota archaeon]